MNLAAIQFLSLTTKGVTTILGIVQALLVVHFLSKSEFGLAGLVTAIGSVIGVTQHLGVVDGAIREIAVVKQKEDIGKLFWVSHLVRQAVTVPLSIGLVILATTIAERIYGLPEMAPLIRIYAASLVLLGIQDVLGATLTGMKKFVSLYVVQIGTAIANILVFAYFTWRFATAGYFWAIILTTLLMVVWYSTIVARQLKGYLSWPTWVDIRLLVRRVLRISMYMYASRILFVVWQRLPLLILGVAVAQEQLGDLTLSLTFGSRLTILAMALSEVNLSWMSSLFVRNQTEFQRVVTHNMQRLFFILVLATTFIIFFAPEILQLPPLIEYLPAKNMVIVMTVAFFMYALIDIGTSSVFVAADQPRWRAIVYACMTAVTAGIISWLMVARPDPFWATVAVLGGALVAYTVAVMISWRLFRVTLLTRSQAIVLGVTFGAMSWLLASPLLFWRVIVFVVILGYLVHEVYRSGLLPGIHRRARYHFICFAGAFYDASTWTNRQHVMSRIAHRYPVLYVEPRVWLARYIIDHWREPLHIARFFKRIVFVDHPAPNLYVKAQWNLIPGSREYAWIGYINHWLNWWNVTLTARILGFHIRPPIVWIYDTEAAEYLSAFRRSKVVYDCVDDHSVQAGPDRNPERVRQEEQLILKRANMVATTSQHLLEQKLPFNKNTHLVEQGGDVPAFLEGHKPVPKNVPPQRPLIGSVGTLDSYKYDFELLAAVARLRPDWHFVLVGEPIVDESKIVRELARLPNIHLIGSVPREQVPAYVHTFDACIIPYRANEYNRSSFPLKFWEFMATGKPIVVSGLPELQRYGDLIGYVRTPEEFVTALEGALASPEQGRVERQALAREHTWEKRVEALLQLLEL